VEDRVVGSDFRPLILTKLKAQTTAAANKSHTNSSMYHTSSLIIPFLQVPTPQCSQPFQVNASDGGMIRIIKVDKVATAKSTNGQ
jgi:hypothetical protein